MSHRWHFFRAGGVDQVSLRDGSDLTSLGELDQKLWVALAMPTKGVEIDPATLELLDGDKDGRVRVLDIQAAAAFIRDTFKRPDDLLTTKPKLELSALKDDRVVTAAKRMLSDLGKASATEVTAEDVAAHTKAFADTKLNGDGIVTADSTDDAELETTIGEIVTALGGELDRSGKLGVNRVKTDAFFAAIDERATWLARAKAQDVSPLGERTAAAADAFDAVRAKIDDFFTRCRVAAFDAKAADKLAPADATLESLSTHTLSATDPELAKLPLAKITADARLPLRAGVNPAWAASLGTFADAALTPLAGARDALTPQDMQAVVDKLAAHQAWRALEPASCVAKLDPARTNALAAPELRQKLAALIDADSALADEYAQLAAASKAVLFQRDFGRVVRNFVNFSDFYSKQDGAFQLGTLYLDARALHLCVPVLDAAKHAALAASSDSMLIYCDVTRGADKMQIAVAITNGDDDNIFVGRNGVFYDRKDQDWDATIVKIVANPISIRQAFWSPYKKLVRVIEDNVTKRAQAANAEALGKIDVAGGEISHVDSAAASPGAPAPTTPTPAAPPPKKIDLGTIAAIGVAIGGIGTLVGALLSTMFGLGAWLPIGIIALLLLISGPAMILAWLKLRRRNLGPILDANGWAINSRARINVAFGAAMTELAKLPPGAQRSLDDPYADKRTPWRRWAFLIVVLVLAGSWYVGRLDNLIPEAIQSTTVLGTNAPLWKKAHAETKPVAPAPAPA
ncbi:MAG TPA: hypothetical protein VH143_06630, partial [Kofleriaceae bacterium]|nr:hypothetical protein [Kofleriaceae bacterium]